MDLAVNGRPDLTLVIFAPETAADRARIRTLVAAREQAGMKRQTPATSPNRREAPPDAHT